MFEEILIQYGMPGIFIAYLIYDRQVLLKKLGLSIDLLTEAIKGLNRRR